MTMLLMRVWKVPSQFEAHLLQTHKHFFANQSWSWLLLKRSENILFDRQKEALADSVVSNRASRLSSWDIASIWLYLNYRCAWLQTLRRLNFLQRNRSDNPSSCAASELVLHGYRIDEIHLALCGMLTNVHFRCFAASVKNSSWSSFPSSAAFLTITNHWILSCNCWPRSLFVDDYKLTTFIAFDVSHITR